MLDNIKKIKEKNFLSSVLQKCEIPDLQGSFKHERFDGGVSSNVWKIELKTRTVCIKQSLEKLKVDDDWHAPIKRNWYEYQWFRTVENLIPDSVPKVIACDKENYAFIMEYFPSDKFSVWRTDLFEGKVDLRSCELLGKLLSAIHNGTQSNPTLKEMFSTNDIFYATRIDPYFNEPGRKNPKVKSALDQISEDLLSTKLALVHGDISPKNILVSNKSPIILDAECAWYGEPAFDLAFLLSNLLLKMFVVKNVIDELDLACSKFINSYLELANWEKYNVIKEKTAYILPALLLGRIDGKVPVYYIKEDYLKSQIRNLVIPLLLNQTTELDYIQKLFVYQAKTSTN